MGFCKEAIPYTAAVVQIETKGMRGCRDAQMGRGLHASEEGWGGHLVLVQPKLFHFNAIGSYLGTLLQTPFVLFKIVG